jgi:hypothetical protein
MSLTNFIFDRQNLSIDDSFYVLFSLPSQLFLFFLDKMSLDLDLDQYHDNHIGLYDVDMNTNMQNNGQNQAEKRAHHNALERKRRDHIKGSFNDLRDVIPLLKGEKASRAHVLKSATDYIHNLKTKNRHNQKAIEDLKRQNSILEFQSN